MRRRMKTSQLKLQHRWETNLSIARLVKSKLNSVFKRFLPILTSVMNYCKNLTKYRAILGTDWVGYWVKKFTQPLNEEFTCCLKNRKGNAVSVEGVLHLHMPSNFLKK